MISDGLLLIIVAIILILAYLWISRNDKKPIQQIMPAVENLQETVPLLNDDSFDLAMRSETSPLFDESASTQSWDPRAFTMNGTNWTMRDQNDLLDQFNVDNYLPQGTNPGWFDTEPFENQKIKGSLLADPISLNGVNTVGSSRKNASHDLRGDIPIPKQYIGPFNNSTIEPDTNIRGIC